MAASLTAAPSAAGEGERAAVRTRMRQAARTWRPPNLSPNRQAESLAEGALSTEARTTRACSGFRRSISANGCATRL